MLAGVLFVSVVYWLFALIVLFPPCEVVSAGLTVEALLGSCLGSELTSFIQYHMRRTAVTRLSHTFLLPCYILILMKTQPWVRDFLDTQLHPEASAALFLASLVPPAITAWVVVGWWRRDWQCHPLAATLAMYAPNTSLDAWKSVAAEINTEFRRIDKFSSGASSVYRVVATDSWLLKLTAYQVQVVHHRDAVLSLEASHTHNLISHSSITPAPTTQLLTLKVASVREGVPSFSIKLNSLEFGDLERKIINPVVNARQIVVQQSLSDFFLEVFMETVNLNPHAARPDEWSLCFGCMQSQANVKLQRRCRSEEGEGGGDRCEVCSCRPMWCVSCLSKWFAARQDPLHPESWLASRAPCPTCRSKFCLLDVCLIT